MPAPLTPIERYLRKDENDRRAKYEQRRADRGLIRRTVWVAAGDADALDEFCKASVARQLAGPSDD